MFQCILVIVLSALLDVWAYVGHVALVPLSSNPQARWRGWPEGQLDIYMREREREREREISPSQLAAVWSHLANLAP